MLRNLVALLIRLLMILFMFMRRERLRDVNLSRRRLMMDFVLCLDFGLSMSGLESVMEGRLPTRRIGRRYYWNYDSD